MFVTVQPVPLTEVILSCPHSRSQRVVDEAEFGHVLADHRGDVVQP